MNLQNNMGILAAFMLYLAAMMGIGIYYSRRQKKSCSNRNRHEC